LSPLIEGEGGAALRAMCDAGGEGIVSKRLDAAYRGGRGRSWIKSKCIRRAEFVVVGWSPSDKRGRPFSSLVLGSYEDGVLRYRGRVGTGFDEDDFAELSDLLKRLKRKTPPFEGDVPSEAVGSSWVTPKLVVEADYTEFTSEGRIRHGVFKGLRADKEADTVSAKAEEKLHGTEEKIIGGVRISSTGREVYPKAGMTKGEVAQYYAEVGERMLEYAADRPLSLLRCPDGIDGECFFQKHAGRGFPDGIKVMPIEEKDGDTKDYMYVTSTDGLIGAAQMGTLEFHIWGSARDRIERPDRLVFDLDPDEGLDFGKVVAAAKEVRDGLQEVGLESVPMVTGGKGVHVIVPLRRISNWDTVKAFARTFAHVLAERAPERYTATMSKSKRKGRVFIDWLRNERGATAIAPWSLRARAGAAVAMPITWDELEGIDRANGFHAAEAKERLSLPSPLEAVQPRGIGTEVVTALEKWAGMN
jgi:bifunctional non-homologous end joining protein LigD